MSNPELTLHASSADALPAPDPGTVVEMVPAPTGVDDDAWTTASAGAWLVLVAGGLVTAFGILMAALDPLRADAWELLHWNLAAVTAVAATALSVRGSRGLTRRIRQGSLVAMTFWLLTNLTWLALIVTDTVTMPSVADVFALLVVVPGFWMLVTSVRGRLSHAEETAVYLDNGLVFLAIGAIIVALFGPVAQVVGGVEGFLVVLFPTVFLGAAVASVVGIIATGQSMTARGGLAYAAGVGLIGFAYFGWMLPTATGAPAGNGLDHLFSVGPLVAAYGAMSWGGPVRITAVRARLAALVSWSIGPVAVVVAAASAVSAEQNHDVARFLRALTVLGFLLLLVRMGLHLRERSETLGQVRRLHDENKALVSRLRCELEERERVHARLVDASRMSAVGELAAAIAHEVNNPLTGVLGYTELLLTDATDPSIRADLEVIRSEALRVRDRVRSLMDFAAPRRPEFVTSDVAKVVGGPIGLLRYHLERQGITIEERHEPMPPVDLDPPSIQQVVINVISDMAGAMPRGGRLTISVGPAGDHARISVEADAPEVDLDVLATAFQPFDDDPGEIPGNRGIAASLGVLRGHDATIGLRHEPGQHPRVEIHLPYRAARVVD